MEICEEENVQFVVNTLMVEKLLPDCWPKSCVRPSFTEVVNLGNKLTWLFTEMKYMYT